MLRSRSTFALLASCCLAGTWLAACENVQHWIQGATNSTTGGGGSAVSSATRLAALHDIAACAEELYADFGAAAATLDSAASAWVADPSTPNEQAVRLAWRQASALWHQADVLRVGSAGPVTLPGGLAQSDEIYSWPLVNRCLVDQTIVSKAYESPTFPSTSLVNQRGLWATEYLVFFDGTANGCSPLSSINANGTWDALGPVELAARKRAYTAVLAVDVSARAASILAAWQGGFTTQLGAATAFPSDQAALNAVSDGIFLLDQEVKDLKLGKPLGITMDCLESSCPSAVESQFAGAARDHVKNDLIGVRRVLAGCDAHPIAFDDLLVGIGAGAVSAKLIADLDAAIALADGLSDPTFLSDLASGDESELVALHAAVKAVTDLLKTEFLTLLDLELPKGVEGDND